MISYRLTPILYFWLCIVAACWVSPCRLPAQGERQKVDPDRAMQSIGSPKWYSKQDDGYQTPSVNTPKDNPIREEGWMASGRSLFGGSGQSSWGTGSGAWNLGIGRWFSDWFSAGVLLLMGVLLALVVGLLFFHTFRNYLPSRYRAEKAEVALEIDPAKVTELPFETREVSYDNPLEQAEALMRQGRFREAIVFLYAYQLLALDHARKVELQKGKTNRMYLRELSTQTSLQEILRQSMLAFEDAYFGDHEISAERFQSCWGRLPEFHSLLQSDADVAAARAAGVATA